MSCADDGFVAHESEEDDIVGDPFEQQSSVEAAKSCGGQYDVHSF
jgi:hypothetical protein